MPISFKSERKKTLKQMYNDICDAYVDELKKNHQMSKNEKDEMKKDAEEWKTEFCIMINDL